MTTARNDPPLASTRQSTPEATGRFWHLTDIHFDPWYTAGASPLVACHANGTSSSESTANTPAGAGAGAPGRFGTPLTFCDSPPALLNLTLANTRRIAGSRSVDFVVVTGDLARHDSNLFKSFDENLGLIRIVTDSVHQAWPHVPLLMSLGNNDVYPHNSLAPHSRFLSAMAEIWSAHIPRDQLSTFRSYGWFARPLTPKLIGVSLNTIALFSFNPNATDCMLDPHGYGARHVHWLEHRVLKRAKRLGHRVLISGHVPPDPNAWFAGCLHAYARVASRYKDVIIGHIFGHVNLDHFVFLDPAIPPPRPPLPKQQFFQVNARRQRSMLLDYDARNQLHASLTRAHLSSSLGSRLTTSSDILTFPVALVSPSMIPNYLPSIRLFDYATTHLVDYHQFLLNLTAADASPLEPEYELEYSARDAYGMADLTSESYQQLALALIEPNPDERARRMRKRFWKYFSVSTGVE